MKFEINININFTLKSLLQITNQIALIIEKLLYSNDLLSD